MAEIRFIGKTEQEKKREEDKIRQGDYVYCEKVTDGVHNFWGIYNTYHGHVVSLDGAGTEAVKGKDLYLNDVCNYWKITKRIHCNNALIVIQELDKN